MTLFTVKWYDFGKHESIRHSLTIDQAIKLVSSNLRVPYIKTTTIEQEADANDQEQH